MLKRFLKFFSNTDASSDEIDHPHIHRLKEGVEGSATYLEFLLAEVEPRVKRRLDRYPYSDPILELSTAILLELFPDYFEESEGALLDEWSPRGNMLATPPGGRPVPPPPPGPGGPPPPPKEGGDSEDSGDESEGGSVDESSREQSETNGDDEGQSDAIEEGEEESEEVVSPATADGGDSEESPEEDGEDDEPEEVEETQVVDDGSTREVGLDSIVETVDLVEGDEDGAEEEPEGDVEPLQADEVEGGNSAPPAGFVNNLDDTAEFAPPPIHRGTVDESIWPVSISDSSILHGSRVLLAVLLDNDRLPIGEQLSVGEILMAADLWVHLIAQAVKLDNRVQKLARLVEKKFGSNFFSQARLLLRLFPANTETRVNNDRQLFYEDMILRMGIRRRLPINGSDIDAAIGGLDGLSVADDDEVCQALQTLRRRIGLTMHLYTREPGQVQRWEEIAEQCERPEATSYVLDNLPPRRWRQVVRDDGRSVQTLVQDHMVRSMARDYMLGHLKTCYFILRAVGDTGLESYLDSFFDWSLERFDIDVVQLLPRIHSRLTTGAELIGDIFGDVYDRHYREPMEEALENFDEEALDEAFRDAMERIADSELNDVAQGSFNLGGFILDSYLEFEHPEPSFAFKLYRLT